MEPFKDKVAVVTGASKGIGAEVAKAFALQGSSVVVNYSSSKDSAEKIVRGLREQGATAIAVQGNVAKPDEIENIFAETGRAFGKVDILVNNAGLYAFSPVESLTLEGIQSMFSVNVFGLLLATKAALPLF